MKDALKEWIVKAIVTAGLGGGLAWGSYLTGQVDLLKANNTEMDKRVVVTETNYTHIMKALDRIEGKLDKGK